MPPMRSSFGRSRAMTSSLLRPRWASGLSWIVSWPRLRPLQPAVTPMVLPTLCTAGSASSTSTTRRSRSAMAANEMSGLAFVLASSRPVSWVGRKPLGTSRYSATVAASTARVIATISRRRRSAQARLRP